MNAQRSLHVFVLVAALIGVSGCAASPPSDPAADAAPTTGSGEVAPTEPTDMSFASGASLHPDTTITMGDALGSDPDWKEVPSEAPGRWSYERVDDTCAAAFRKGPLGDAGTMTDREASDAVIAATTGWDPASLEPLLNDGAFPRYEDPDAAVDHRQFTYSVNDAGYLIAVRAFTSADYSVIVTVECDSGNLEEVARDVLSKTAISIE